jgi:uncharacterized protein YlxW (UPF0749 family)
MALGFLLVVQLRAGRVLSGQEEVPTRNVYALAAMLRQERQARRELEGQVAALTRRLEDFETAAARRKTVAESLDRELVQLRAALGLIPLTGPGVVVTVDDGTGTASGQAPPVVQYVDLEGIVNELWAAGAEAVAISGVRVTAMTGLGQVGGTIVAQGQRLSPPYTIAAIGDPQTLEGALAIRGGIVEGLRALGLRITTSRRTALTVPAAPGIPPFRFARPAAP